VKLPQPFARFPEIRGGSQHVGAATSSAPGVLFETLHALAEIEDGGLDFRGHSFDLREHSTMAEIAAGADLYSAS
jgi:hypothetical protein